MGVEILPRFGNLCRFNGAGLFRLRIVHEKIRHKAVNIVFYDSTCGLCQRSISLLIKIDSRKKLLFAPLNGETFQRYISQSGPVPDTVIFFDGRRSYMKSAAFFAIMNTLGGVFRLLNIFRLFPVRLLDWIYDAVAGQRSKFSCKLITFDERFLP